MLIEKGFENLKEEKRCWEALKKEEML